MRWIVTLPIALLIVHCSTIDTRYYLAPEYQYRDSRGCEVPCARYVAASPAGPITLHYWAVSGQQKAFIGPCLLPLWPTDNNFVASRDVYMHWRLEFPPGAAPLRIEQDSFQFRHEATTLSPTGLTQYDYDAGTGHVDIAEYYSVNEFESLPDYVEIETATEFQIWLLGVPIGDVENLSVRPRISVAGVNLSVPEFRFHTDQEYSYNPFESPFYFPGPR